jgi:hypothetical protein
MRRLAHATNLQAYELQLLFVITPISRVKVLTRADVNEGFLETILPFGEVTLHSSANVQRHDVGVCSDENPRKKV